MREIALAARNVVRQQRRSMVALFAIAGGVVALLFAGGFIDWILRELREQTIRSQLGHIQVTPSPRADPKAGLNLSLSGSARAQIASLPHVKTVAARLSISGLISRNDATLAFIGQGVEAKLDLTAGADDIVAGRPLDTSNPRQILVGEGLATSLEVRPGDSAVLLVNLPRGGINATDVVVGGVFRTVSKAYDDAAIRIPLGLAQELLKTTSTDKWVITLDRTESTDETLAALRHAPSLVGLEFTPWRALADFYNKAVELYARQFAVMQALIAIIIVLSIQNTMMMSVYERTSEIGTMMAIGTSRAAILRMFITEGVVLGVIGGLLGVAVGFLVNAAVSLVGIPMPPAPGMAHGFLAQSSFGLALALPAFLLAVITTCIAAVIPAIVASRLIIVDALRTAR
jgi:putative ABC transport system permease protein